MRYITTLIVSLVIASCSTDQVTRTEQNSVSSNQGSAPELQKSTIDSAVQFLMTSAATDFRTHGPAPLGFRNVRIGHDLYPNGEPRFILCGEFLRAQEGGNSEWVPFATVKTSGYEQWLGPTMFCQGTLLRRDLEDDLSSTLQSRYDSLK